ncbi:MAG: hypothetical protein A3G41_00745 [Elusimicrobia bacterium RIFCSPLOWO2_12_FULL_59_9]|nr:MAG: hypothetical protein A3G41_00745 [Elusimicrobia bacterium RIFCSPLOWO2_12_FULL_59_9]
MLRYQRFRRLIVILPLFSGAFWTKDARAQALMTSARQMPEGSSKLIVYYQGSAGQDLNFALNGSGSAVSKSTSVVYASQSGGDVKGEGDGGGLFLKWVIQPWEQIQYYALAGAGKYALHVPSATVTNTLSGERIGWTYGAGMRAVLHPDTPVMPAIALDAAMARSRYFFSRLTQGSLGGKSIDHRLDLYQYQLAFEASHRFADWEPYGGVRWQRIQTHLSDSADGSAAGGIEDGVSPFLGVRYQWTSRESLVAEAAFVKGVSFGCGLEIKF